MPVNVIPDAGSSRHNSESAASFLSSEFMPEAELSEAINKGLRTLRIWRQRRIGPAFIKCGNSILYRRSAVSDWLRSLEVDPATEKTRRRG